MPETLVTGSVDVDTNGTIFVTDAKLIDLLHTCYHAQIKAGLAERGKSLGIHVKFAASPCNDPTVASLTTQVHQVNSLCTC